MYYKVLCKYITWKMRYVGLIWLRNKHSLVFLKLHPGKIFSSILFSFRMLHVVFCVQVLFTVLGSTWLLLLAATMLTFHRPNADLTLEVIPDDLLENKSLRKKTKQQKPTNTHTNIHTNVHTSQKSFPLTIHCIVLAKGGKCKICNKLGRCAASSEERVGDVPMFWLKIEEEGRERGRARERSRELWDHFQLSCSHCFFQDPQRAMIRTENLAKVGDHKHLQRTQFCDWKEFSPTQRDRRVE